MPATGGVRPGSGRPKGVPNTAYAEMRRQIMERVNPLQNIIDIAAGRPINGVPNPTDRQVLDANELLLRKVLPDLRSLELTGEDGAPLQVEAALDATERIVTLLAKLAGAKAQANRPAEEDAKLSTDEA